jgi:hypothetical protein
MGGNAAVYPIYNFIFARTFVLSEYTSGLVYDQEMIN